MIYRETIRKFVLNLGVMPNLYGYRYIISAIDLMINSNAKSITKDIYPTIANEFDTTASRVERAIRHAIKNVIDVPYGYELLEEKFKCKLIAEKFTNSQFLYLCKETLENECVKK